VRKLFLPLFLLAVVVAAAARPPAGSADTPSTDGVATFKTTSRLVLLDVVVTDLNGQFASGLTKDDFNISEDGKPQKITAFEAPGEHPKNPYSGDQAPVTIFVLDELNTSFQDMAYARNQLTHYFQSRPQHLDQPSALIALDNIEFKVLLNYSQDRDAFLAALKSHIPRYPARMKSGVNTDRLASSLVALQQIAASTVGIPVRKNVIWVGAGYPAMNLIGIHQDQKTTMENMVSRTINKLLEARITVYPIDPTMMESLQKGIAVDTADPDTALYPSQVPSQVSIADRFDMDINITALGPATGGRAFYWRNDIDAIVQSSVDDGGKYYTLAYVPSNRADNPKYRSIHVTVRRGLVARTRQGYFSTDVPMSKEVVAVDISQAAQNTLPYTGLPITLTGKARQGKISFTLYVNAQALSWQSLANGDGRGQISVAVASFSAHDKRLSYQTKDLENVLPAADFKGLRQRFAAFHVQARLPQDAERLRIIVRDKSSGRMGTLDVDAKHIPSHAETPKALND